MEVCELIQINFPFYPISNESAWYCGRLELDEERKALVIRRSHKRYSTVQIPLISPYASTSAIDVDALKNLCDENSNVIMTIHYTKTLENEIKTLFLAIYLVSHDSKYGIKFSFNNGEGLIIGIPTDLREKISEILKDQGKILIELDIPTHYFQESKQIIEKERIKWIEIDKVQSYAQTLHWPFYGTLNLHELNKKDFCLAYLDLINVLLGSLVLQRKTQHSSYVFPFFPTPLLSAGYLAQSKGEIDEINVLMLPSVNIYDSGTIIVKIDLEKIVTDLCKCIYNAITQARRLLHTLDIRLNYELYEQSDIFDEEDIYGDETTLSYNLDAKAVLKALLNSFLFTDRILKGDKEFKEGELKDFIKREHPHTLSPLYVDLDAENTVFHQLGYIGVDTRSIKVWRSFVRSHRTDFLAKMFSKLYIIKSYAEAQKNYDEVHKLFAAYLLLIDDYIEEFFKQKKKSLPNVNLYLDKILLAKKLTMLLIEYGVHGISHLLTRYLSEELKIKKSKLNEITALIIPKTEISSPANLYKATSKFRNIVIDGYHYRLIGGDRLKLTGLIIISGTDSYSAPYWNKALKDFDLRDVAGNTRDYLNTKNCYAYWYARKEKILPAIETADSSLQNLPIKKPFSELVNWISSLFGLNEKDVKKAQHALSIPLSEFRRLLICKDGFIDMFVKDPRQGIPKDKINETAKTLGKEIKSYLRAIYEAVLPFCFDGCFNCVLIDRGCSLRNPLLKEWVVSRFVAENMLNTL